MAKVNSLTIGGVEYPIKVKYNVMRDMLDRTLGADAKKTTLGMMHDWVFETVMSVLNPNPFKSIDDLKKSIDWDEYQIIDNTLSNILRGDIGNPQPSSDVSTS